MGEVAQLRELATGERDFDPSESIRARAWREGKAVCFSVPFFVTDGVASIAVGGTVGWVAALAVFGGLVLVAFVIALAAAPFRRKRELRNRRLLSNLLAHSVCIGRQIVADSDTEQTVLDAWSTHARELVGSAFGQALAIHAFAPPAPGGTLVSDGKRWRPTPEQGYLQRLEAVAGHANQLPLQPGFDPTDRSVFDGEEGGQP